MKGDDLSHLRFLPEPSEPRLLTAIDPTAPGYGHEEWKTGKNLEESETWQHYRRSEKIKKKGFRKPRRLGLAALMILLLWLGLNPLQSLWEDIGFLDADWPYTTTGISKLYDAGLTGSGVRVCIVDTGIDIHHPDLADINLVGFRDFLNGGETPIDNGVDNHGTMMAGLLVANGTMKGAAPNADLLVASSLGRGSQTGSEATVADAIEWCWKEKNAHVISLSLGGKQDLEAPLSSLTSQSVVEALDHGVFVIAAAGNDGGLGDDGDVSIPANVNGVIAVGATNKNETLWQYSSMGSLKVGAGEEDRVAPHQKPEVIAPGVNIISTWKDGTHSRSTGTSDATVFVTGALSLILEANPELRRGGGAGGSFEAIELVKTALMKSCRVNGLQEVPHDSRYGYGHLDAYKWNEEVTIALSNLTAYALD